MPGWNKCVTPNFSKIGYNLKFQKTDTPDSLVTRKLIPKGTLGLLYTSIGQIMTRTTVVYVAAYPCNCDSKLFGTLQRVIKRQR